jgi:hypothetical protein
MAKRARGSHRPGQRRPIRRTNRPASGSAASASSATPAAPATAPVPPGGLTEAEEARAAELESRLLEEERAAEAARARGRAAAATTVDSAATPRGRGRPTGGGLATQYAHEYDYVGRDLRRIAILATSLTGIMLALWILIDVVGVFKV